jgi:hypothetical protein
MGTMAPIRPAVQRQHRISLTAGRPLGGLLEALEMLEVVCRPGGVRLAAGVPGGGVPGEGEAEDEQRSRCADSSPQLLERRPTAVLGGPFVELPGARPGRPSFHHRGQRALPPCLCLPQAWIPASSRIQLFHRTWHGPRHSLTGRPACWRRRRCQSDVSAKVGEMPPLGVKGHDKSPRIRAKTAHPAPREGINMHGFIKRAAVAPGYGPVASDVR